VPHLERDFWQKSKDEGLAVIGVNREEDAATARKFVEQTKLTYPNFLDPKRELYSRFTPKYVPYNVVIDPEGRVVYSAAGFDQAALNLVVKEQLAKRAEARAAAEKNGKGQ
jgi:peroxiredoxin